MPKNYYILDATPEEFEIYARNNFGEDVCLSESCVMHSH